MKSWIVRLFVFVLLAVATPLVAQAQYVVQDRDTLWGIAERNMDAATAWEQIYAANAFLHEPGRRSIDARGRTIVVITPGEYLAGVNKLGLVTTPAVQPEVVKPAEPIVEQVPQVATSAKWYQSRWLWWLLGLLAFILLGLWLYRRKPTEWRPVVEGGVDDAAAANLLERQATQRGATVVPGSQQRVRLHGIWGTQHRGIPVPIPHRYNGERAWRARFRMANGTERSGFMLQGCGNDVTIGGAWYVPFAGSRVEEGWGDESPAVVQAAQPEPPPAPVAETPATAPVVAEEAGVIKLEVRRATDGQPAMVRMTGVDETADNTCELRPGVITLRFTPRQNN